MALQGIFHGDVAKKLQRHADVRRSFIGVKSLSGKRWQQELRGWLSWKNDGYRGFVELVAGHIAAGVGSARSYQAQQQRAEALAELDRAKTAFFSNISHEFRTPLTLILGPVDELRGRTTGIDEQARQELELVHRNGLRLAKLVNTLLDFSRIQAGRMRAQFAPADLSSVTAELASVFRSAIDRAGLTFTVDCPPLDEPVYLDREMWEKVVLNLLSNALKFTFEGSIIIRVDRDDTDAIVTVTDTGIGVPVGEIPRLFERFHRIETSRARSTEGSGIGLALVKELVGLHAGTIRADSREGAGTTFTVRLPFGAAHLPDRRTRPGAWDSRDLRRDCRPVRAGSPALAAIRHQYDGDYCCRHPSRGRRRAGTSVDRRRQRRHARIPDQPAADLRLSGKWRRRRPAGARGHPLPGPRPCHQRRHDARTGRSPTARGAAEDPRTAAVPVLLLSARAGQEASIEGLQAGADDYLVKPFAAAELLARVRANIELARTAQPSGPLAHCSGGLAAGSVLRLRRARRRRGDQHRVRRDPRLRPRRSAVSGHPSMVAGRRHRPGSPSAGRSGVRGNAGPTPRFLHRSCQPP